MSLQLLNLDDHNSQTQGFIKQTFSNFQFKSWLWWLRFRYSYCKIFLNYSRTLTWINLSKNLYLIEVIIKALFLKEVQFGLIIKNAYSWCLFSFNSWLLTLSFLKL